MWINYRNGHRNGVCFSTLKCKVLHGGNKNTGNDYFMEQDNNKVKIQECDTEMDLGVTFDGKLNFNTHIEAVINKAN